MRRRLRRVGTTAVATVTMLVLAIPPAHADPTTGTITGRLTDAGAPVAGASVSVLNEQQTQVASATTNETGDYLVPDLPAGGYLVQFSTGTQTQWAHQHLQSFLADTFPVNAGATTVVDEVLVPTGSIGGTLSNSAGPVVDVRVSAQPTDGQESFGHGITDGAGRFNVTGLLPGNYLLSFFIGDSAQQWYPQQLSSITATPVAVVARQRTEITETLLPTGSVTGRLTENGVPVEGAFVTVSQGDFQFFNAVTDADGRYAISPVFATTYVVRFFLPDGRTQFAHGKVDLATADHFTVTADAETVVDEAMLPTGQVDVRAVDATTGAPVAGFCADILGAFACTDGEVATFAKVPAGTRTVTTFPSDDRYLTGDTATVQVTAGGTAAVTVQVTPAVIITTTVIDRRTGEPVEGVCLSPVTLRLATLPDGEGNCSDDQGHVRIARLAAGTYTLFASVHDGVHGAQWVGATGGTGSQFAAQVLTVRAGQTVNLPSIRMDPAGSISGRVTDKATGAPLQDAVVSLLTSHPGAGPTGPNTSTDADGRYTLDNLGPYDWPVNFRRFGYASQWSGGVPSRLVATPVRVKAGRTVTADARLSTGTTVRGTVTVAGHPVPPFRFVAAYEAVTGDIVGSTVTTASGYEMRILGPTAIRINIDDTGMGFRWYRDSPDFAHATVVLVPSNGTKALNLAFS